MNALPSLPAPIETTKLPTGYKPLMMSDFDDLPKEKSIYKSDLDKGFTKDQIKILIDEKLQPPSQLLKSHIDKLIEIDEFNQNVGKIIKKYGRLKGTLSKSKTQKDKNKDKIDDLTKKIKTLQDYRERIDLIKKSAKTLGTGIYTQKKRNAYKIS